MADTAIAITAGTGTNVDTRTEATNGNHRQVIVIGDPSTNAGVAPVDSTKGLAVQIVSAGVASGAIASGAVASGAIASGAFASGAVGTGAIASGAVASGAVASGAFASGSIASGAIVDGADVNAGATSDAASATTTMSAKLRGIATALGVTALDLGSGTGGSRTLRFFRDTAQWVGGLGAVTTAVQRVTIADMCVGEYETVAASQTAQVLGATGGTGDYISGILVIPATTSPGNVLLLDNATSITVFTGGATSVSNLVPFFIPLGMISVSGAWKITTGTFVSCIGIGNFT